MFIEFDIVGCVLCPNFGCLPDVADVGRVVGCVLAFVLQHHIHTGQCPQDESFSGVFLLGNVQCTDRKLWFALSCLTGLCSLYQGCIHCFWTIIFELSF